MLIDCHSHVWDVSTHYSSEFTADSKKARNTSIEIDAPPEKHWKAFKNVDKAIVFGLKSQALSVDVPNDYVADYVNAHPEKLIGFACVDPNDPGAVDELERSVQELKLKGLKLSPIYQNFDPLDENALRIYERAQKYGLPIMFHQGTTFATGAPLKYANPVLLEDVAYRFPDLKMIIAHLGHPWEAETIVLIRKQPNIYADISALYYRPWQFYNSMTLAIEYGVTSKLFFGTDYPFTTVEDTVNGLLKINDVIGSSGLPKIPASVIEEIIHRDDTLKILELE